MVRCGLRGNAGRPDDLSAGIDTTWPNFGAHECGPHPGLAIDVGHLLDRRRACGRTSTADALGRCAWYRIALAGRPVLALQIQLASGRSIVRLERVAFRT